MDQQTSTSTVTVEYFDPHDVYKLLAPGLVPRLPLRNLHWQSHAGPIRSIETLHVELLPGGSSSDPAPPLRDAERPSRDDGFQNQPVGGQSGSSEAAPAQPVPAKTPGSQRRHQIPGLRRTPYLKVLLVRCDDNDSYKASVRLEVREWLKLHTPPSGSSKKSSNQEKHDAFEWLIIHVVIPNTAAANQPRSGKLSDTGTPEKTSASSRWRTGSLPLLEKLRSDFNASTKGASDRVAQIRIGINDDAENAWGDLVGKFKTLILSSFDRRVTQYEEDIKEKDAQRSLPGWNFCTFFILKEGLARGFESVGLVEDALVGYDELGVGLDSVLDGQAQTGSPERHGGAVLSYTDELKTLVRKALAPTSDDGGDVDAEDFSGAPPRKNSPDDISISSTKKAYRDRILENKVSVFDFRCYIFSRQISLLLRLGNASSTREELLAKLTAQHESVLRGVAPLAPPMCHDNEPENLQMLAEICRRTLEFIPFISQVMRQDLLRGLTAETGSEPNSTSLDARCLDAVDNIVSSFAFSVAQQILAQTSTRALPIPSTALPGNGQEPKALMPEPKTMMHPARSTSLRASASPRRPPSPGVFPGPGRRASVPDGGAQSSQFLKVGIEELAARRAELYMLSRSVLGGLGKRRGWSDGWDEAPMIHEPGVDEMDDVSLNDGGTAANDAKDDNSDDGLGAAASMVGIESHILRAAMDGADEFYRLYEILTDKALWHHTVAGHQHAVQSCRADLAVLKVHIKEYKVAADYFCETTLFFGGDGWCSLELSMLAMYARCLSQLQSKDDFVRIALKLLTKACAERARLQDKSALFRGSRDTSHADKSPLHAITGELFSLAKTLPSEVKLPLASVFTNIQLDGPPVYHDRRDACSLLVALHSLLPIDITIDAAQLKVASIDSGPCKELAFEKNSLFVLSPGKNHITLDCNSIVSGKFIISHLGLLSSKLYLYYDQDISQPREAAVVFKDPKVRLFQRTGGLDVRASASKHTCLDKNNALDFELSTGWNDLKSCEIRVRPATGGLRLLTTEAKFVDSSMGFARPPESGAFFLGPMTEGTRATFHFPYSVEQDVANVLAKLEVKYVTQSGEAFFLAKALTIPVSLALGVNVQDVFKHHALFSRFIISTATSSPISLHRSELLDSELFESAFGVPPQSDITVFPKQPASLLYRVKRKAGTKTGKRSGRTMYLKLHYSVLQTVAEDVIRESIAEELGQTRLEQYSGLVVEHVLREARRGLEAHDFERAALLGEMTTAFLDGIAWEKRFAGLGTVPGSSEAAAAKLGELLCAWQRKNPRIGLGTGTPGEASSLLIPVEIPSLSVVHTADMRLHLPEPGPVQVGSGGAATVCVNQMVAATLRLRWTRAWDTETAQRDEQAFGYEVAAPAEAWLLGGRRKGRFVIPGSSATSSRAETEAEIPLMLVAQREGWLPLPTVEIREMVAGEASQACEVDWRNVGETVRAVKERRGVTVSLDASGPAGGPLVLESEGLLGGQDARMVA
ncbi:trafficking protein particle complex subunit 10, TRAPPC10 domain-containing protein [Hirsutella rhossiliensis]|uniref:Trafficking protein particle complex subunit 10, TRAPPC10 domain-containing protein n=1 Tax=Hirsutella rhossiliensis TaxID=111463 RepID=A0A9P8SJ52_9HYPO|nr:trafficking protein particle complex subunit 10, TRAPPC10 domain-containing protein [Hirsutella rhossiliensis]KAH0962706.1 trafficking protein particle complex subunit 10, TRAPPC10 domain-containing protein [Hirsutella rhossiliensis]